ncbi:CD209 antigen-like protein A [Stigmatopora argus]
MLENEGEENLYALADRHEKEAGAESSHYAGLHKPSEDIYSKIAKTGKSSQGTVSPYKIACLILSLLCAVLLVAAIVLCAKTIYQENKINQMKETCNPCRDLMPTNEHPFRCPDGWVRLNQSSYCFFFSKFQLNRNESNNNCTERGGTLAMIKSDQVQNFLTENVEKSKYWIDLQNIGYSYEWSDGTFEDDYRYFGPPSDGDIGDCFVLDNYWYSMRNWRPHDCNRVNFFICQIQL